MRTRQDRSSENVCAMENATYLALVDGVTFPLLPSVKDGTNGDSAVSASKND